MPGEVGLPSTANPRYNTGKGEFAKRDMDTETWKLKVSCLRCLILSKNYSFLPHTNRLKVGLSSCTSEGIHSLVCDFIKKENKLYISLEQI